ncbi:MAG TPA: glycosyltransferase, partial [Anaerohalosphaeraceae bacterium]|nr:glycosyltransferase [Anaerohalosphaeraceae bacterium]
MEKNRIKLAILESKYYGAVTSVNDLVVRLDKERFDVTFLYLSGDPGRENHLQQAGYKVCYLSRSERMPVFRPDVLVKLIRFLRRNQIDLLHCHAHKA